MSRSIVFLAGVLAASTVSAAAFAATPSALFNDNCSACHQTTGKGVKGAFPALAGDPFVQGDPAPMMATVLAGRAGMPSFKDDLNDLELASVLTYVRTSWGNKGKPVSASDVAAARAAIKAGKKPASLQAH
ncbi:c-type cytochrome [Caulobacter rhizosphaerae]|jgi:mono/diheme cytochrome c family protein|uniref:Mono/diheme cytochrome c family protein n=1 Tax=Caulobacter rhizosphaerae TaxID=2010972 RepID=A0ABU1MUA2_9CAUL|nr:cytochrome c [Caulobacter rhizosphaerae]MDR6529765.1 mono/diheme cytochrome c family protein [Caulobacter rhizosphaerae]GGL30167.1 cytochrome c [Caulobacter rhizosphaerae]